MFTLTLPSPSPPPFLHKDCLHQHHNPLFHMTHLTTEIPLWCSWLSRSAVKAFIDTERSPARFRSGGHFSFATIPCPFFLSCVCHFRFCSVVFDWHSSIASWSDTGQAGGLVAQEAGLEMLSFNDRSSAADPLPNPKKNPKDP